MYVDLPTSSSGEHCSLNRFSLFPASVEYCELGASAQTVSCRVAPRQDGLDSGDHEAVSLAPTVMAMLMEKEALVAMAGGDVSDCETSGEALLLSVLGAATLADARNS